MRPNRALQQDFETQIAAHQRVLHKVVNVFAHQPDDRSDLAQDILVNVWRAFPTWDRSRPFSTWLYRIALNVAISASRRARPAQADMEAVEAAPDPQLGLSEEAAELYRYIHALPNLDRAMALLYLEGHTLREIAEIIGLTETNVSTRMSRLKAQARRDIGMNEGDEH